jgi:outer membrane protein OmpA-like peptidoglycan-associated protein
MNWTSSIVAGLLLVGGCNSKSAGITAAPSESAAASGTPESVLPDSPTPAGDATATTATASAAADAFVRTTFDAHAQTVVQASCGGGKLRLTLDGVLFDFDHDNLQAGADDVLTQVKKATADAYPSAHLVVEGHTDNVGSDAHNDDLSTRRANTVVSWLQAHGVAAARLAAKGYGKRWPRVPNTTEANRAKNRRVELIVLDQTAAAACKQAGNGAQPSIAGVPGAGPGDNMPDVLMGKGEGGGPLLKGSGHPDSTLPSNNPAQLVAFSFYYNDNNDSNGHICLAYDPSWLPPGSVPMGYPKKDFSTNDGRFIDHCPTENLIATCDFRSFLPKMEWYYQGMTDAKVAVRKEICVASHGKYVRVAAAPAAIAKLQPDTTHKYLGAHDMRQLPAGRRNNSCAEYRDDGPNSNAQQNFDVLKALSPKEIVPRCAIEGATGRCDNHGVITFYFPEGDANQNVNLRSFCETTGGTWSQP